MISSFPLHCAKPWSEQYRHIATSDDELSLPGRRIYDDNSEKAEVDHGMLATAETPRSQRSASIRQIVIVCLAFGLGLLASRLIEGLVPKSLIPYETRNSPARFVAEYEPRVAYPLKEQEIEGWRGPPTKEVDDLWTEISNYKTMVLSREELELAGENMTGAVELKTGGYLALLGVFHELHCVDEIRKYIYKDIYYPNNTREDDIDLLEHIDHCIDILRESITCTGDLTVFHFEIMQRHNGAMARVLTNTARQCLKLEPVIDFVRTTQKGHEEAIGVPKVL